MSYSPFVGNRQPVTQNHEKVIASMRNDGCAQTYSRLFGSEEEALTSAKALVKELTACIYDAAAHNAAVRAWAGVQS